jgi:glycosyltransferase involved in cell wall biosynthesis
MSAARPTVSVLLPVLNGEPYLAAALQALRAQSCPPDEILVLDGGSTDGSRARALGGDGITLVDLPGTSCLEALNLGLARAVGDLIAFTSSDDVMEERAVERHLEALTGDEEAGYSYGNVALFADEGGVSDSVPAGLAGSVQPARVIEAMMVRRTVLDQIGEFRTDLGRSGDVEWVARLGDLGIRAVHVDAVVVAKRLHRQNSSYTHTDTFSGITRSLRQSILRKRGSG